MFYAVVFRRTFEPGEHWSDHLPEPEKGEKRQHGTHRVDAENTDRRQPWHAGDLYSTASVIGDLPPHLEAVEFPEPPPEGWVWDRARRRFVPPPPGQTQGR